MIKIGHKILPSRFLCSEQDSAAVTTSHLVSKTSFGCDVFLVDSKSSTTFCYGARALGRPPGNDSQFG